MYTLLCETSLFPTKKLALNFQLKNPSQFTTRRQQTALVMSLNKMLSHLYMSSDARLNISTSTAS